MKIRLFNDRTALLLRDGKQQITVEPACAGTLEIEGRKVPVKNGTVFMPMHDLIGHVRVIFTAESGSKYVGIRPLMAEGIPVSRPDYEADYAAIRIHVDDLERQVDKLAEALHRLSAEEKHDALGFLTSNTKKQEVR